MVFIGPRPDAIHRMGDKVEARKLMAAAGVPVVPGSPGTLENEAEVRALVDKIGLPIMIKAAAGGGGKGMRLVEQEKDLASAVRSVASEAQSSFGDGRFYVEKFLRSPHHIEVQVLADSHGNTAHLFERECSIQRRNQKVVEESPSPFITPKLRKAMGEVAVRAAQAVDYLSAGTIEFLVDADRNFYFMEMNTRIQVEHPITELVTGIDLVKAQIEIAAGGQVPFKQSELRQNGWAIECRVYAEDPEHGFVPAPGRIDTLRLPEGPGVRNDCGVYEGSEVSSYYDPMISKLVTWGRDRAEAIGRMRRALSEYMVSGTLITNLNFHRWLMDHPRWVAGEYDTRFINDEFRPGAASDGRRCRAASAGCWPLRLRRRAAIIVPRPPRLTAGIVSRPGKPWGELIRCGDRDPEMRYQAIVDGADHELEIEELSSNTYGSNSATKLSTSTCAKPTDPHSWCWLGTGPSTSVSALTATTC